MFFVLASWFLLTGFASAFLNDSCRLTPHLGSRSPLYTTSLKVDHEVFYDDREDVVYVKEDQVVLFYCTGARNYFQEILPTTRVVGLTCVYGDVGVDVSTLQCQKPIEPHLRLQRRPCSGASTDTTYFELGFELPFGIMYKIIDGCFDNMYQRTLYTNHLLDGGKLKLKYGTPKSKSLTDLTHVEYTHGRAVSKLLNVYLDVFRSVMDLNFDFSRVSIIEDSYKNLISKSSDSFDYKELFITKLVFKLYQFIVDKIEVIPPDFSIVSGIVDYLEDFVRTHFGDLLVNQTFPAKVEKGRDGERSRFTFDEGMYNNFYGFDGKCVSEEIRFDYGVFYNETESSEEEIVRAYGKEKEEFYINSKLQKMFEDMYQEIIHYRGEDKARAIIIKDRERFGVDYTLLSPAFDFAYGQQRRGIKHYLNNVPMFSTIIERNWKNLENRIRNTAISYNKTFRITTGVHDILEYPHKDEQFHQIFLGSSFTIPVPKYVYKIVVDPKEKRGIVFVLYNSKMQFIVNDLCTNICESGSKHDEDSFELLEPQNGYIICCAPQDFWDKVPTAPKSDVSGGVLYIAAQGTQETNPIWGSH